MVDLDYLTDVDWSVVESERIGVKFEGKILNIIKSTVSTTPELFSKSNTKKTLGPSL